jgi:hypothetical protein
VALVGTDFDAGEAGTDFDAGEAGKIEVADGREAAAGLARPSVNATNTAVARTDAPRLDALPTVAGSERGRFR